MKYRDRFDQLEELGNPNMGRFMLSEVLTKMATTCKQCQRDRMRCTLRPLCPDRIFLNILITLGAKTADLPLFCYQVHLRNLQSYLKSGAKRDHPLEPRFPLSYFRRYVQFKKDAAEANFLAFKKYLEQATKKTVNAYSIDKRWYFGVGNGIFIVDMNRNLVSLDPDGDIIRRPALEPLITFLMETQELQGEILKDMQDTWYLRVSFPKFSNSEYTEIVQPNLQNLKKYWAFVRAHNINKSTQILISLDPAPNLAIRLQGLRETTKILTEIASAAPKPKKQNQATKEDPDTIIESPSKPVS
jgi:hypothetical protein